MHVSRGIHFIQSLNMLMKFARHIQSVVGAIPALWILLFLSYILSANASETVHSIIWYYAFVVFIVAFHAIWIWLVCTIVISVVTKKIVYERFSLIVYMIGAITMMFVILCNPGNNLYKLLD